MAYNVEYTIDIENAKVIYRNFSGASSKFNRAGDRNFCVVIDDRDYAMQLANDGWNIKIKPPRDEDDKPMYYLQVKVSFDNFPPNIYLRTSRSTVKLTEETVDELDHAEFKNVDLSIRPYNYNVSGKEGVSAYLGDLIVTIVEPKFAHKYDDIYTPHNVNPFAE